MLGIAAWLAAALAAVRAAYPRYVEWRASKRRRLGPDGVVVGAGAVRLERAGAPAVLVLHGAGDTAQAVAALAVHLHSKGFAVRAPLLSGHGRGVAELRRVRARDWQAEVEREFDALVATHPCACVVGLSMGGALAISLAARRQDVRALVLLAPYVAMTTTTHMLAESARWWGPLVPYFSSAGGKSIHDPAAAGAALGYGLFTPEALSALAAVVDAAQEALRRVHAPTLMIQSAEDNRIARGAAAAAFERLGAPEKEMRWIHGAGHVITVDFGHDRVFEATVRWLTGHCSPEGTKGGEST